jgi:hypothetical protein
MRPWMPPRCNYTLRYWPSCNYWIQLLGWFLSRSWFSRLNPGGTGSTHCIQTCWKPTFNIDNACWTVAFIHFWQHSTDINLIGPGDRTFKIFTKKYTEFLPRLPCWFILSQYRDTNCWIVSPQLTCVRTHWNILNSLMLFTQVMLKTWAEDLAMHCSIIIVEFVWVLSMAFFALLNYASTLTTLQFEVQSPKIRDAGSPSRCKIWRLNWRWKKTILSGFVMLALVSPPRCRIWRLNWGNKTQFCQVLLRFHKWSWSWYYSLIFSSKINISSGHWAPVVCDSTTHDSSINVF